MMLRRLIIALSLALAVTVSASDIHLGVKSDPVNITVYSGESFSTQLEMLDSNNVAINLTGNTYEAKIWKNAVDTTPLAEFTTVVSPATGTVTISISATQSAALAKVLKGSAALWTLVETDFYGVKTLLERGQVFAPYR